MLELLRVLGTHNFGTWSHCCWVSKIGTKFRKDLSMLRPSRYFPYGPFCGPTNLYTLDTPLSVGITFIQLLAVLLYHVLRYVNQRLYSRLEKSMVIVKSNKHLKEIKKKMCSRQGTQLKRDATTQEANEVLDMVDRPGNTIDSQVFSSSTVVISKSDYMIPQLSLDKKENLDSKPKELSQQSNKSQ